MKRQPRKSRRLMLVRDPLDGCVVEDVVERVRAIGEVIAYRVDDLADTAYIIVDTTATDYALSLVAHRWRIRERPS